MEEGTDMDIFQEVDIPDLDQMLDVEDTFLDQYVQDLAGPEDSENLLGVLQDRSATIDQPLPAPNMITSADVPRQIVTTGGTAVPFLSPPSSTIPAVYNPPRGQLGASYSYSDQGSGALGSGPLANGDSGLHGVATSNAASYGYNNTGAPQAAGGVQKPRRRRVRNTQQQVQNKLAQQRYREKRKNKFNDLQESVVRLTAQVERLHDLESDKALLKGENESLSVLVAQQREKISQLQQEIQKLSMENTSLPANRELSSDSCPGPEQDPCCATAVQPATKEDHEAQERTEQKIQAKDELAMFKDVEAKLKGKLDHLRQLIQQYQIDLMVDAKGVGLSPREISELERGIKDVCTLAVCHTRQLTLKVVQEKYQTVDEATKITCPFARERFQSTASRLCLTPEQEAQLLDVRQKMLARLRSTYEERQKLNMELVSLMLPHRSQTGEFIDTSADSKIALLSRTGVFPCVAQNLEMHQKLEDIRRNIRKELGIHACANYQFATRILSPVQAAVGLVEMDPVPLDVLGLGNFVLGAKERREATERGEMVQEGEEQPVCNMLAA